MFPSQCKMKLLKVNVECWRYDILCVVLEVGTISLVNELIGLQYVYIEYLHNTCHCGPCSGCG